VAFIYTVIGSVVLAAACIIIRVLFYFLEAAFAALGGAAIGWLIFTPLLLFAGYLIGEGIQANLKAHPRRR